MRRLLVLVLALAGCGGGSGGGTSTPQTTEGSPTEVTAPAPRGTEEGRLVVSQSGCLACHLVGVDGNDGPGQNLAGVGARLSRAEIRRSLLEPVAPMPSYQGLSSEKLEAVVDYLAALR